MFRVLLCYVMVVCILVTPLAALAEGGRFELPSKLRVIEAEAFAGLKADEVTLPEGIEQIGPRAFADSSIKSINLPDSVDYIASTAFKDAEVQEVHTNKDSYAAQWVEEHHPETPAESPADDFYYGTSDIDCGIGGYHGFDSVVVIPRYIDGLPVTTIAPYSFQYQRDLERVIIPNTVTRIGGFAFYACTSLENIIISDSVPVIEWHAFSGCTSLKNVTIPNSVTHIEMYAFYGCQSLTNLIIPNSVISIGNAAFRACTSLKSVSISNNVRYIGESTFDTCRSLTEVTIPNSVTTIGNGAFSYCDSLTNVTIPNSVIRIDSSPSPFYGCDNLKTITVEKGSYAEKWAKENGYDVDYIEHIDTILKMITPGNMELTVGETCQPGITFSDGASHTYRLESGNEDVVLVNGRELVAVKPGEAVVTVSAPEYNLYGRFTVTVKPAEHPTDEPIDGEQFAADLRGMFSSLKLLYQGHKCFDGGYTDADGNRVEPIDIYSLTDKWYAWAYAQLVGCNANTIESRFINAACVADQIMDQLTKDKVMEALPASDLEKVFETLGFQQDVAKYLVSLNAPIFDEKASIDTYNAWMTDNTEFDILEDVQELSDLQAGVSLATAIYESVFKYAKCLAVDHEELKCLIDGLYRSTDEDALLLAELLEMCNNPGTALLYIGSIYGFKECQEAVIESAKSAILNSLKFIPVVGPYLDAGGKVLQLSVGAGTAINNALMNIDEIQANAYQLEYAIKAAKSYVTVFFNAYSDFLDAPTSREAYDRFKPYIKAFSEMVAAEWQLYATIPEALDDGAFRKFMISLGAENHSAHIETCEKLAEYYRTNLMERYEMFGEKYVK
ncbi:MAG: leucine-rich repeat protein [bacterium]